MNPDSLRALGDDAASRRLSPMEVHAHADQWQAERKDNAALRERLEAETEGLRESLGTADETIAALRERLAHYEYHEWVAKHPGDPGDI